VPRYVKRRSLPVPGSIPDALGMFRAEVRFYREIAPVAGVRVPACYQADVTGDGTILVLEDLSEWRPGADPVVAATVLAGMHRRWQGRAALRWPWLRPAAAAADLVEQLFSQTWALLRVREDLPSSVAALGEALTGRVTDAEHAIAAAGPPTLVHGDASTLNMRTSPDGAVALVDWEDVSAVPGVVDLAWMLTSSVDPARWDEVITAYGPADGLVRVLPAAVVQGLLSLAGTPAGSAAAMGWTSRLEAAARRM
jgi:hypothetical protein